MKVVTLVPWRGGDELREQSWSIIRPYLEALGWPIVEGDCDGLWSRGAALNAAAAEAGDWDVAVIADADTFPPEGMVAAVAAAVASGGGVRPHDHLYRLSPSGSIVAARSGIGALEPRHIEREHLGGGLLVVTRRAWDDIGGFDDRFVGWGHEDSHLNLRLALEADWDVLPGDAYHLWHPDPTRRGPEYRQNRSLLLRTQREKRLELEELSLVKGYDLRRVL